MGGKKDRQLALKNTKSDFSLNDFANTSPSAKKSGRMKKSSVTQWQQEEIKRDDLNWYEKDLSDFETSLSDEEPVLELEKTDQRKSGFSGGRRRRKKQNIENIILEDDGYVYPFDLWCMLGNYIHPEDIQSFALLCKGSHLVVHSAKFWYNLYRRMYVESADLPLKLQAHTILRKHGLRTRVIRALFYIYPPLHQRISSAVPFEKDPDILTGMKCILMWHKKCSKYWHFFFKFERNVNNPPCALSTPSGRARDSLLEEINIHNNPEDNCWILQAITPNYISLPVVMGQMLSKTFVSVGHDMRYHKLKLIFNPIYSPSDKNLLSNGTSVVMDPVVNVFLLPWWHPKYPYNK